eukprot:gene14381-biopygen10883
MPPLAPLILGTLVDPPMVLYSRFALLHRDVSILHPSSMLHPCFIPASSLLPPCFLHASPMLPPCFLHASLMLPCPCFIDMLWCSRVAAPAAEARRVERRGAAHPPARRGGVVGQPRELEGDPRKMPLTVFPSEDWNRDGFQSRGTRRRSFCIAERGGWG